MRIQTPSFRRTTLARTVLAVCSASAAVLTWQPVFAQTPAASAQTTPPASVLQRVEITGSNIRRADTETASPVQVITREEIDRSGKGTVAEYLQTLTADGQGSVPSTYGRGFAGGSAAGISLRGLGANATLVLVNGRRIAPAVLADDGQRQFTDLKQIPLEAVERVEVVKDGASAIYGSDAIAGVVNIILRKSFIGTVGKASYGRSRYGDGGQSRAAITHGFGDIDTDGYNILFNFETGKQNTEYYRDRTDRGSVGVSALANGFGFDPLVAGNSGRFEGLGAINVINGARVVNNGAASIVGNVRNPATNLFYSRSDPNGAGFTRKFPDAGTFCNANSNLPQTNPGGGCIVDIRRAGGTVLPDTRTNNFLTRGTFKINSQTEGFAEFNYYSNDSRAQNGVINAPSAATVSSRGVSTSNVATTLLGATHPDNPYFGTAARLAYLPLDVGFTASRASAESLRVLAGVKGTLDAWDYDTAFQFSQNKQKDTQERTINVVVARALLNPTAANVAAASANSAAYRALPAGTFLRIAENAGLNSPDVYSALLQDGERKGFSRTSSIDIKASRELGKIEDRAIGLAVGAEYRLESNNLPIYSGQGQNVGLGFVTYGGKRNVFGAYGEILVPVLKTVELTGAIRYDKYSDAGNSVTPKVGAVWKVVPNFSLRGTYAEGFRAPSFTENGVGSFTSFAGPTVFDRVRIAAGVAGQAAGTTPAFIQGGNPNLKPEESQSFTMGAVWDITPKTSFTADFWQIKRKGLIVIEQAQQAVDAGRVTRDPSTSQGPNDPGALQQVTVNLINAAQSKTSGFDLDGKHRFDLGGGYGRVTIGGTYTRLIKQTVTDPDGTVHEFAGTHGNCDITNCIGSPKDKLSAYANWQFGTWSLTAITNYRGSFANTFEKSDTTCAQTLLNGADAPGGCKIKSFSTVDVSARWQAYKNTEIFGSILNFFDSKPPLDPLTYGAIGYNPLDYSGAQGRYFSAGLRHKF